MNELISEIKSKINDNNKQAITGGLLQGVLVDMVKSLCEVYPQTYTDEEKAQARANIDALSDYDGEITKEKLSVEVQAILNDVANKQNINDASLATIAKTIVGAINELFNGGVKDKSIATSKIEDGAITEDKLASQSVTNAKIANASVSEEKITDNSVSTEKLKDGAITEPKLDTDLVNVITSAVQPAELASAIAAAVASYVAKADIVDTTGSATDKVMSQHGVTEAIDGVANKVTELENEMNYSDGVAGLAFNNTDGHNLAKQAIKAVWLTYGPSLPASERAAADALRATLANTKFYITDLYNVAGTYGCFLQIKDAVTGGSNCFSLYVAGIHTITGSEEIWDLIARTGTPVYPSGFTAGPFAIHFAIDWNVLNNKRVTKSGDNPIEITFGQIAWGTRVDTMTLKEKVESMAAASVVVSSIDLSGKKIVCLGDSITEIVNSDYKHYSDYIAERTGATMINCGFGGTQLRQRVAPVADFNSLPESTKAEIATKTRYAYALIDIINLVKAITSNNFTEQTKAVNWLVNHGDDNRAILARLVAVDWTTVDGVTVCAGTNDWGSNKSILGTSGSADVNYTLGAVNEIIRILLTAFPNIKIYWFTPIVRWMEYAGGTGTDANWSDVRQYADGTLRVFAKAIQDEVALNHIPVCDLYNTLGINKANFANYFPVNDGTHPKTVNGLTLLGKKITAFILANNTL